MKWLVATVFAALVLSLPLVLDDNWLSVYVLLGLSTIVVCGISLLMGYAGQVSLGQGAFYAIGAYTASLLAVHGQSPLLGLVLAPIVTGLAAALVGWPLLKLHGHYLAFGTLALQLIVNSVAGEWEFAGGAIGLQGIPQFSVGGVLLDDTREYAWLAWGAVLVVLLVTANIIRSRPGRGLRALATSESAAASAGVPVARYKITVFAISGAFAGLAGGIYGFFIGYIAPGSFSVVLSIGWVVMAVVGGLGTVWGAVVGTATITLLAQVLNDYSTSSGLPDYAPTVLNYAVYALLLILVVLYLPRGLVPSIRDGLGWVSSRRPG